ncbi:hypothetical protein EDD18DRAFT_291046 [Armillaria luteobubalina]|uniref:Apple domain-containing protein n=1 Tax=Armillaria luteobubalina TaxID=153913 RepID=A0AA39Q3N7_9AGAR|nr:hypothetical protein EDD18DRAFT_291046 [Armillaria luteobubalina]
MRFFSPTLIAIAAAALVQGQTTTYELVFDNLTAAINGLDFITFTLVDTVHACMDFCDSVEGCLFINPFHDVNGKDGSPDFTCSVFTGCHTADDATNTGGQTQPDGTIDSIADSSGFCKTNVTVTDPDA